MRHTDGEAAMIGNATAEQHPLERRYLTLARLGTGLGTCSDWSQLASMIARSLGDDHEPVATRLWGSSPEGHHELARFPQDAQLPPAPGSEELRRAADRPEPCEAESGSTLAPLHSDGLGLGLLELGDGFDDHDLLIHCARFVAVRFSMLASGGAGPVSITPHAIGAATDPGSVMTEFAAEARGLLEHDRLSAYLLTPDGRAFERFAVAGSPLVEGEGVLIPYVEVGLRHVIETNRALVSDDLTTDPRIVGREDRVIAKAGYHGLISVPLRHGGRPFGVLNFVSRHPSYYSRDDIPVAEQIASQISAFVENLRVQRQVRTYVKQRAADEERARISRDLFQTVAESTASITHLANELREGPGSDDPAIHQRAVRIASVAEQELAEIRRAVADLTPRALDLHSLTELIEGSVERLRSTAGIEARLEISGDLEALPTPVRRAAYRIVQESLNNVALHSGASTAEVKITAGRDLELRIADDGSGFDPSARGSGLGISHMRDRAEMLGGLLTVESAPGRATAVEFTVSSVRDSAPGPASNGDEPAVSSHPSVRMLVVEPQTLNRDALVRLIDTTDGLRVVGEAAGLEPVPARLRQLHPDLLLIGTELATAEMHALIGEVKRLSPHSAILVVGELASDTEAELLAEGISGVIRPAAGSEELVQAINAVSAGAKLIATAPEPSRRNGPVINLGKRERAILSLVAAGETNAEIGKALYLATKTVERQIASITRKLDARNRAHAAAIAISRKIVPPPGDRE